MKLRKSNRRGTSLVEVVVALSISVSVLSTATMLLHRMFSQQQIAKADANFHVAVGNLAHRFRTDVHAGSKCTVIDEGSGLEITGTNGAIIYRVESKSPHIVWRESKQTDGNQTDSFSLPTSASASFGMQPIENGAAAQMLLRLPDPTARFASSSRIQSDDAPALQIEAAFRSGVQSDEE